MFERYTTEEGNFSNAIEKITQSSKSLEAITECVDIIQSFMVNHYSFKNFYTWINSQIDKSLKNISSSQFHELLKSNLSKQESCRIMTNVFLSENAADIIYNGMDIPHLYLCIRDWSYVVWSYLE